MWSRWALWKCAEVGRGVRVEGRLWIHGKGTVRIGDGVVFEGKLAPIELHAWPGAEMVLGKGVIVEGGTSIEATRSVRIGERSRLGAFSKILDNHFHRAGDMRSRPESAAVVVGPGAVLGPRSVLLPGVTLGPGEQVAAGEVRSARGRR